MVRQHQTRNDGVWIVASAFAPWATARQALLAMTCQITPRDADLRRARDTTRPRPDAAGRFFPCRLGRRGSGRRAARDESRALTAAWFPRRRAAVLVPARRAGRPLPAPRPAPPHWCGHAAIRRRRSAPSEY